MNYKIGAVAMVEKAAREGVKTGSRAVEKMRATYMDEHDVAESRKWKRGIYKDRLNLWTQTMRARSERREETQMANWVNKQK